MPKVERDFFAREVWEQKWLSENTWCDTCDKADLGLREPHEYEENGEIFVEGKCNVCGSLVVTHLLEKE